MKLAKTLSTAVLIFTTSLAAADAQESKTVADTPATEQSPKNLPKGINDNFLDPDLKIDEWVERFEVESREVVACQKGILAACGLKPGMTIADVGSGTGLYVAPFSRTVGDSGEVIAVDISPKFVKHLKGRIHDEKISNARVVLCSNKSVNLKPESIDRAFICDVYHHFEFPQSSLESIHKALRPGGRVILVDFHREIEGPRREWMMNHIRAPKEVFQQEIIDAGFKLVEDVQVEGFKENYLLVFEKAH